MVSKKKVYRFLELNLCDKFTDPANYVSESNQAKHTVEAIHMSQRFIKELARAHDALTDYGKDHYEGNELLSDYAEETDWGKGDVPVLAIQEGDSEPGEDFIVIYNYEGVMRMTGIMADSHCHVYVYKINQN